MKDTPTNLKQEVKVARHFSTLRELTERTFKLKHIDDLSRKDIHDLRFANVIEKSERQMGKETVWTLTDEAQRILTQMNETTAQLIAELDNDALRMLSEHTDLIAERLPDSVKEPFTSSAVEMKGRTPEGLRRHGFIEAVESRDGYATTWKVTSQTQRAKTYLEQRRELLDAN